MGTRTLSKPQVWQNNDRPEGKLEKRGLEKGIIVRNGTEKTNEHPKLRARIENEGGKSLKF